MINLEILAKYVAAAKQQNREAFTFLFNQTKDYTYNIALSLLSDAQEAQDIVQEVYLRVWLRLPELREDRSFLRWLHTITFNISQDHLRQRIQEQNALDSAVQDVILQKNTFDEWFLTAWKHETICDMVQALPDVQREAIQLFYFQNRTVGEIAVIQNCSINTVKSRLFYARNTLQKLIEDEEKRTGEMHLSPTVIALTSVLMLPMLPVTLPHAESVRILMAVFAAAESLNDGVSFAPIFEEQDAAGPQSPVHRFLHTIRRRWMIRVHSGTVIALAAVVICAAAGLVFYGKWTERQKLAGIPAGQVQLQDTAVAELNPGQTQVTAEFVQQTAPKVLAQGQCGDSAQFMLTEDGVLTIAGSGKVGLEDSWRWTALQRGEDQSIFAIEDLDPYRDLVKEIIVEDGITEIGYAAFARSNVETVSLPDSCTRVASGAFFACRSLKALELPPHVVNIEDCVLKECTALQTLVVSEDAQYIGSEAFADCFELQEIIFRGNALREIGSSAFCNLPALKSLRLPDSVEKIMSGAIDSTGLDVLDLSNLKNTVIDGSGIRDCNALKTLLLPEHMDKVGSTTVYNCPNLTTVVIGSDARAIAKKAFHNAALTEITIPAAVSSIAVGAFAGNQHLTAIYVDDDNPYFCDVDGVLFNRSMDTIYAYPRGRTETSYILPESVRTVAGQAFAQNRSLVTLVVPGDIKVLEHQALLQLQSLTGLYFQSALPEIWADGAISECDRMMIHCSPSISDVTGNSWTAPDGSTFSIKMINFSKS